MGRSDAYNTTAPALGLSLPSYRHLQHHHSTDHQQIKNTMRQPYLSPPLPSFRPPSPLSSLSFSLPTSPPQAPAQDKKITITTRRRFLPLPPPFHLPSPPYTTRAACSSTGPMATGCGHPRVHPTPHLEPAGSQTSAARPLPLSHSTFRRISPFCLLACSWYGVVWRLGRSVHAVCMCVCAWREIGSEG